MRKSTILALAISATLISCGGSGYKYQGGGNTDKEQQKVTYTKYDIPLPVELFTYLIDESIPFNPDILNNPDKGGQYTKETEQAAALGLYSADLAYCAVYNKQQAVMDFFNCSQSIAESLNVSAGFDRTYIDRFENNIECADSLSSIASNSYWTACNFLDENGKNNILPFVIYSSWVESLYLTIKSNDLNDTKTQIISQKQGLLNLISYLYEVMIESSAFYYNMDIKLMIWKLNNLKTIYEKIIDKDIDPQLYSDICSKIVTMRNEIVTPPQKKLR
ncbi:MAG: hypothetical protein J5882_03335 [Bacteroidales bacterium]|nr:hypothetical protein [Bacteroidales bacterium]